MNIRSLLIALKWLSIGLIGFFCLVALIIITHGIAAVVGILSLVIWGLYILVEEGDLK